MNKKLIIGIVLVLIFGGIGYYAMTTSKSGDINRTIKYLESKNVIDSSIDDVTLNNLKVKLSDNYDNLRVDGESLLKTVKGMFEKDSNNSTSDPVPAETEIDPVPADKLPVATITLDGYAPMTFELYPNEAPQSVYNFISLANSGFYDGLTMHRIQCDFVAQGGDPEGTGTGGPGYSIKGEFSSNGIINNYSHKKGALAWARSSANDSAGSQFYITLADATSLDGDYAVFGEITSGQETLDELNKVCGNDGTPTQPVTIKNITVDTKGIDYPEPTKITQ